MIPLQAEIILVAAAYSILLIALQRVIIDVDRMYELRAHMNTHQKHLMELTKRNATKEEIAEKQKSLMAVSSESMKMQMKPMIVTLPLYAVLYYLVLPRYFSNVPNFHIFSFTLNYGLAFIVFSLILTMVLQQLIAYYDRRRLKDKYNFGIMQSSFKEEPNNNNNNNNN